jgi:AbrB family looped-hinge helix DNA binding protein
MAYLKGNDMREQFIKIGEGGRVVIPAAYRKLLNVRVGDELVLRIQEGELRLFRQSQALKRIRTAVKQKNTARKHTDAFLRFRTQDSGE